LTATGGSDEEARMLDRRAILGGIVALPFAASHALAQTGSGALRTAPLGRTQVPIIGLGTARRYEDPQGEEQLAPLRATIKRFAELGGTVIDMASSYGRAEEVIGQLVAELGVRDKLFLATKVGADTREAGTAQVQDAFRKLRTDRIDMIAVHNLRAVTDQLALLRDLKKAGKIGALGITTSFDGQYEAFEAVMRKEPMDVIQVDYALDKRNAAARILPLAQEKGLSVMINLPFGRSRLFETTRDKPLPGWAAEIGATTWAQVFLKYVVSHPSRPIAVPGMAQVRYVEDNLGAARGVLPDAAMRTRMEQFIDGL
jgi:aryl-alcohol dehydrogenase-like predicted oxidoreductase